MDKNVVVLVPMYNEAAVVGEVVRELRASFDHVVCIDDGSEDSSAEAASCSGAQVLRHHVNLGQGAALQTGFDFVLRRTDATHVVTFDADGQHAVDDAVAMVERAVEGDLDIVLGSRATGSTQAQPLLRRAVLAGALRYSRWFTGLPLTDTHNGLRVLSREALRTIRLSQCGMAYASELERAVGEHALRWAEHPVHIAYTDYSRAKGQSNLNAFNIVYDLATARLRTAA